MSGLMAKFFANFIPIIALLWALDLLLVFRILYRNIFYIVNPSKLVPSFVCIGFVILFIMLPIRTCINSCYAGESAEANKTYDEVCSDF